MFWQHCYQHSHIHEHHAFSILEKSIDKKAISLHQRVLPEPVTPRDFTRSSFSIGLCSGATRWSTGEGSNVSSAAGGIKPRSIKLKMPF